MYDIMERDNKKMHNSNYSNAKGKAFYLSKHVSNNSEAKVAISRYISSSVSKDMSRLATNIINYINRCRHN